MSLLDLGYWADGHHAAWWTNELRKHMPQRLAGRSAALAAHLDWCREHVPMYAGMPIQGDPFQRLAWLAPFDKARLDADHPEACARGSRRGWRRDKTSGTSGCSFHFWVAARERALRRAYETRANELLGLEAGGRHLVVWGGHESHGWRQQARNWLYGRLQGRDLVVVPSTGPRDLERVGPLLERHRGGVLVTYPGILGGLLEAGWLDTLRDYRALLLTGEAVDFRAFEGMGLALRNRYGTREFGALALGWGQDLHYFADRFILEDDPDLGLMVTDLARRAMPLLRYPVGDFVQGFEAGAAPDPRTGLPPLGRLQGRVLDRLCGASGRAFVGTFWTLTLKEAGVRRFRIRETAPAQLDVEFVADFDAPELERRLAPRLAGEFIVRAVKREDIPELRNAKQKIVAARAD